MSKHETPVDADGEESRGRTIPLPPDHWWLAKVRELTEARAKARGERMPGWRGLWNDVKATGRVPPEIREERVVRCANGRQTTWELAKVISEVLDIPPPAFLSSTESHARALAAADEFQELPEEIRVLMRRLRGIEARVKAENAGLQSQPAPLPSADGTGEARKTRLRPDRASRRR